MTENTLHNGRNTDPTVLYLLLTVAALVAGHLTDQQADAFATFGQTIVPFLPAILFGRR